MYTCIYVYMYISMLQVANECWDNYMARNQSRIIDYFAGQYKSALQCTESAKPLSLSLSLGVSLSLYICMYALLISRCVYQSTKFDSFVTTSLPIPGIYIYIYIYVCMCVCVCVYVWVMWLLALYFLYTDNP